MTLSCCGHPARKRLALVIWLALFAVAVSAIAGGASDQSSFLEFNRGEGFCLRGVIPAIKWDPALGDDDAPVWGSFCDSDAAVGQIVSQPFLAPSSLSFFVSGYIGLPGRRLYLRNRESGEEFDLIPKPAAGDSWRFDTFPLPASWLDKSVEMVGEDKATAVYGWFGFTAPRLPYSSLAASEIRTDRPASGFCNDNKFRLLTWGNTSPPPGVALWRSFCASGDKDTGYMASEPFIARAYLGLYVVGYPGTPGVRLRLENLRDKRQLPLQVTQLPYESVRLYYFPLPREWKDQPVRVLAEDNAIGPGGWIGFALVRPERWGNRASFGFRVLLLIVGMFVVTMLPAAAACILAARRGVKSVLDLTAVALLAIGTVGYAAFWAYFFNRRAGEVYSWASLLLFCGFVTWALATPRRRMQLSALRCMRTPCLLVLIASLFVLSLGFINGKASPLQEYGAQRFGPPYLSVDNWLPKILADFVYLGHIPKPMVGDWLSSDRPPLQAGNSLWNYAWTHGNRDVPYQILGTILQFTFLAALWAYLEAAGVSRRATALIMAAALFSGFTIENSFFVWPKLFPVSFLLIICAYLFTDRYPSIRADWRVGVATGAAAAFAMLCHGGSAFGLLGIALTILVFRRLPSLRFSITAAVAAVLLFLPWTLYQKYSDPPGDRLLKMHLAATPDPHPEIKFSHLLVEKYKQAGWHGVVENKIVGFQGLFDDADFSKRAHDIAHFLLFGNRQQREAEVASLRDTMFLRWFWSIDILSFAAIVWLISLVLRRPRSAEFHQSSILWICTAFSLIVWCLLMFRGGTIVHQGCYFTEITAFAASVLTLWAVSRQLASLVVALHIVLTLAIYVLLQPPKPVGMGTFFGPVNTLLAWASALSAISFFVVLWRISNVAPEAAGDASVEGSTGLTWPAAASHSAART